MVKIILTAAREDRIRNKQLPLTMFHTPSLIRYVMNQQPEGGLSMEDIRKRNKVLDKLEEVESDFNVKLEGDLLLEDSEFDTLKACVKAARWPFVERAVEEFDDMIANSKKVEVKATAKPHLVK